ncbi:MAG: hypothetical protein VX910_07340 [Candidatus Latescibacterota bacterium]|nr:hypothetical protein [Candidatus Latescibacterota bacterium]
MSDQDPAEITRTVIDHTAGRALTVTTEQYNNANQAIAFTEFATNPGAEVHMVLPPDCGASYAPEFLRAHYTTIADIIPIRLVTNVFIPSGEAFLL